MTGSGPRATLSARLARLSGRAVAIIGLVAGPPDARAQAAAWPGKPTLEAGLRAAAQDLVRNAALGSVVAVALPGRVQVAGSAGHVDRERQTPMDPRRHFQVGSISKMFTATAIMRLVKDGRIGLDRRIVEWVTGYAGSREVTVRHLLTQTSGIGDAVELFWPARIYPTSRFSFDELLTISRLQGQQYEAGARFKYNETGMNILGRIVELESGSTLGGFLRHRITAPLGMRDTYSGSSERWPEAKMARGYFTPAGADSAIETTTQADFNLSWAFAGGDVISTTDDLLTWARALLDPANPTGVSLGDLIAERVARETPGPDTGYGFGIGEHSLAGRTAWGHGGHVFGYLSFFAIDPAARISVVVFCNLDGDLRKDPSSIYSRRIVPAATSVLHLALGLQATRDGEGPR